MPAPEINAKKSTGPRLPCSLRSVIIRKYNTASAFYSNSGRGNPVDILMKGTVSSIIKRSGYNHEKT